ncbi:hypothetical protein MXB_3849 [Myxobolus squamalis]|nr:hypothetical protein MXB_3849 [Myxobolus squamalis]
MSEKAAPFKYEIKVSNILNLCCINFPGYFSDYNKALEIMGGSKNIIRCIKTGTPIELKLRQDDPFCIPLESSVDDSVLVLARFSRKKVNDNKKITVELLGVLEEAIKFNALADFQVETDQNMQSSFSSIFGAEFLDVPQKTTIVPNFFSRRRTSKYFADPLTNVDFDKFLGSLPLHFEADMNFFESFVKSNALLPNEKTSLSSKTTNQHSEKLMEMFKHRPLCTSYFSRKQFPSFSQYQMKTALSSIAHFITSGPFKKTWCIDTYDPKSNPDSAK